MSLVSAPRSLACWTLVLEEVWNTSGLRCVVVKPVMVVDCRDEEVEVYLRIVVAGNLTDGVDGGCSKGELRLALK